MSPRKLFQSLNAAVEGFIYVLKTQRNMRLHFLIATLILVLGIYLNMSKVELFILMSVITLVLVLEMVNTAIELTVDLLKDAYHPVARIIKDIAAGAVFLAAINAAIIGYIMFSRRFALHIENGVNTIVRSPWHLTFIALLLVLFLVLAGKVFFNKGTPFRGGMPSGHAAFAFSLWTIIVFTTRDGFIAVLAFVLAFFVARSRLKDRIHTVSEVVAGASLGVLITALIFQLLL